MRGELKKYESEINKKHSFGLAPNYEEEFRTSLNKTVFFPIAEDVVEELGWELVYVDESSIEARKNAQGFHWGQKIVIEYQSGRIRVNSKSIQAPLYDFGRNSKRVKLFIHAFKELEGKYEKESLIRLEEKVNRANNWDDYDIPNALPQPKEQEAPKSWIPIIGGVFLSFLLGFLVAFLTVKFTYVIGIYEVAVGFLIGLVANYLIRLSNYTDFDKWNYIIIGVILLTYFLNQYFVYELLMFDNDVEYIGFVDFMYLLFQEGLKIKSVNTGWIGLVISWVVQIVITYGISYVQLASHLTQFQLERVPMEVVDFAVYHFVKGKDDNEVRRELSKMGWSKEEDQNDVFESIGALQGMQELNRMR